MRVFQNVSGVALVDECCVREGERSRQVHVPDESAEPQRDALLPRAEHVPRGDDGHHLHADGGPGVPRVRAHLPAAARPLREPQRPRAPLGGALQLARARRPHHVRSLSSRASPLFPSSLLSSPLVSFLLGS